MFCTLRRVNVLLLFTEHIFVAGLFTESIVVAAEESSQTMVPAHNYLLSQFPGLNICKHEIIIAWQKNITISPISITTDSFVNIPSLLALDPVFLQCFYNVMATQ